MKLEYSSFVAEDGATISYADVGSGRPLVYLIGFDETVAGSNALLSRWSARFRCIAFDHRGYGASTEGSEVGVDRSARDLQALLERLDLSDAALVGYSMGGSVALSYIEQFGDARLSRLVLADATPKLINEDGWSFGLWQGRYTRADYEKDCRALLEDPALFRLSFYLRASTPSAPESPPQFPTSDDSEEWLGVVVERTGIRERLARRVFFVDAPLERRETTLKYWRSMTGVDRRDAVKSIQASTLCLFASPGSFYSPSTGRRLVELIPDAKLEVVADAAHTFPKDKFEEYASRIESFCAEP